MGIRFMADGDGAGDGAGDGTGGQQGNYTAPATQAELDRIITDRLAREKKQYEGFDDYKAKAAEWDKHKDSLKSGDEKASEQLTQAETRATTAEQRAAAAEAKVLRYEVAAAKKITGEDLVLLTATTKEDLEKQADVIATLRKGSSRDPGQGQRDGEPAAGERGKAAAERRFGTKSE
jgi:hypothetical protein